MDLSQKVSPQDNVVIYFSGHGFFDRSDHTGHLVTVEASEGAVWQYFSNANLVNRIRAINSFHTFLIVDSCFSGSLFVSKEVSATPFAEKVEGLPSRWALAAGQIETVEDGLHGDHSPFAKALLTFLEKNNSPLVPASFKKGARVTLIIPSHLAYGEAGVPPTIPPRAKLAFYLELVDVQ